MPIPVKCKCGKQFAAPDKYAGKSVKCPECGSPLVISPGDASASPAKAAVTAKIAVKCKCGKAFSAKPELAGKSVRCPGCNEPIQIPAKKSGPTSKPAKPAKPVKATATSSRGEELFDELKIGFREGGGRRCPECKRTMKEDAIVCIECGYNENLGRRMKVERPITKEDRARKAAAKLDGPPKGKKKKWFF